MRKHWNISKRVHEINCKAFLLSPNHSELFTEKVLLILQQNWAIIKKINCKRRKRWHLTITSSCYTKNYILIMTLTGKYAYEIWKSAVLIIALTEIRIDTFHLKCILIYICIVKHIHWNYYVSISFLLWKWLIRFYGYLGIRNHF